MLNRRIRTEIAIALNQVTASQHLHELVDMANHWLIMTTRFGVDIREPSDEDLRSSLQSAYIEAEPSLTEADYAEHPNTWLKLGYEDGPLYLIDVYRSGTVRFEQWADTDYEQELAAPLVLEKVSFDKALSLWRTLRAGNIPELLSEPWQPGR